LYAYQLASHCIAVLSMCELKTQNKKPILKKTQISNAHTCCPFSP
jgi:hypothetical protein